MRAYLIRNTRIAWYAGKLGTTVRVNGLRLTMPTRHLAGVLRLGGYERNERYAIRHFLPTDRPVIDVGGGIGVVACVTNASLVHPERHRVVEANLAALPHLIHNRDQNAAQFEVIHAAIGYTPTVQLVVDSATGFGFTHNAVNGVTVGTRTLAQVAEGFERFTLICDIDGAEIELFEREADFIEARVGTIILERHPGVVGIEIDRSLHHELTRRGFSVRWQRGDVWVYEREQECSL